MYPLTIAMKLHFNNSTISFSIALFFTLSAVHGQTHSVGLRSYEPSLSMDGYNLFFPTHQGTVYLVDNCGEVVHTWPDASGFEPGQAIKLMEDGSIFIAKGRVNQSNAWIQGGGGGEKIEHRDWDNNLLWTYTYNDSTHRMHHDFAVLPNGNVILIAWERIPGADVLAAGRNPSLLADGELWPDHLIEVQPIGADSGAIVWEWHAWDHIIQDYDNSKPNYGNVASYPERIDLNYSTNNFADWHHMNTIDYHPGYDLIMLSVPVFNEVWIIDHGTTTSEAAGHTGGQCGRGGDLVFRWGNPAAYRQGDTTDQMLFFQHDSHWMDMELSPSDPDYGKIMIFNNRSMPNGSTVCVIDPVFDTLTHSYPMSGNRWLPAGFDWNYSTPNPAYIHSVVVSSAQRLPNGNTLIFAGRQGYGLEITPSGQFAWEYIVPFNLGWPVNQGDVVAPSGNLTFRMKRYSPDWPGFTGRTLTPQGYIELNPDTHFCANILTQEVYPTSGEISVYPNPTAGECTLSLSGNKQLMRIELLDIQGRLVETYNANATAVQTISLQHLLPGMYLLRITDADGNIIVREVIRQ